MDVWSWTKNIRRWIYKITHTRCQEAWTVCSNRPKILSFKLFMCFINDSLFRFVVALPFPPSPRIPESKKLGFSSVLPLVPSSLYWGARLWFQILPLCSPFSSQDSTFLYQWSSSQISPSSFPWSGSQPSLHTPFLLFGSSKTKADFFFRGYSQKHKGWEKSRKNRVTVKSTTIFLDVIYV